MNPILNRAFYRPVLRPVEWVKNYRPVLRPVEWAKSFFPDENASVILTRIREAADEGIRKAKTAGIPCENRGAQINNDLNHALIHRVQSSEKPVRLTPHLQDRVVHIDWGKKQIEYQKKLVEKLAVFATFIQMRNQAGIVEKDNFKILELVKKATGDSKTASVWKLFVTNYKLTLFGKLRAAIFYCLFYHTSLIVNTIDAYLDAFITRMTSDLTINSNETRIKFFRKFIANANQFLLGEKAAIKTFTDEHNSTSLEELRDDQITKHYGGSLSDLCKKYSKSVVEEDPRVKILKDFQKIPVFGYAFQLFSWLINKVIIQWTMKSFILPQVLEVGASNGLEATQPDRLPFAISLTQFFTSRLEELKKKIENPSAEPAPIAMAGTELLRPTIALLIDVLELEGHMTPRELRQKMLKLEKPGWREWMNEKIRANIETSVLEASHALFSYLNETIKSHEFIANVLECSLAPFEGKEQSEEMLIAEFEQESLKFERTAESILQRIVQNAIEKQEDKQTVEAKTQAALLANQQQITLAGALIEKIDQICMRLQRKVTHAKDVPTEGNGIQQDLVKFLQHMQVLNTRKEFQDSLQHIDATHRNEIRNQLNPKFRKIEALQSNVLMLQEASDHYSRHHALISYFGEVHALFTTVQDQFHAEPRHVPIPLLQSLGRLSETIEHTLNGATSTIPSHLKTTIHEISELSTQIAKEQKAIDAIYALYPPRDNPQDRRSLGLLDQIFDYQRGIPLRGFRPRDCLKSIAAHLIHFSDEERRDIESLIGNGANLTARWGQLGRALQSIYERHTQSKNQMHLLLDQTLNDAKVWIDQTSAEYAERKTADYQKMQTKMGEISTQMRVLQQEVSRMRPRLSTPSDSIANTVSMAIPIAAAATEYGFSSFGAPGLAAMLWGAGSGYMHFKQSSNHAKSLTRSAVKRGALTATVIIPKTFAPVANWAKAGAQMAVTALQAVGLPNTAATYLMNVPDLLEQSSLPLAAAVCAPIAVDLGVHLLQKVTYNQVWRILTTAYRFTTRNSRIHKAAMTRFMVATSEQ